MVNKAVAQIYSCLNNQPMGFLTFMEYPSYIQIFGQIYGLSPGFHGFHIHNYGFSTPGCSELGGHYNPLNQLHGPPVIQNMYGQWVTNTNRHLGDLGNILANNSGIADINTTDTLIRLSGPYNIAGRSIVIHQGQDDLGMGNFPDSKINGHSGPMVAYGAIIYAQ